MPPTLSIIRRLWRLQTPVLRSTFARAGKPVRTCESNASISFRLGGMMRADINVLADGAKMSGDPEEEDENWFRPPWETDDDAELEPALPCPRPSAASNPITSIRCSSRSPRAQDAVTRLETRAETASAAVAEGLLARLSYREAAGWLGYAHVWIHPHDLALRDRGLTGSYGAAFRAGRLEAEIPATTAREARIRKLAVRHSRRSGAAAGAAVAATGGIAHLAAARRCRGGAGNPAIIGLPRFSGRSRNRRLDGDLSIGHQGPLLIRAGRAARDWMNRPGVEPRNPGRHFSRRLLCGARKAHPADPPALLVGAGTASSPARSAYRAAWMADFLDCVAAAAKVGLDELGRLQQAEEKSRSLGRTARSRLPDAVECCAARADHHRPGSRRTPRYHAAGRARSAAAAGGGRHHSRGDRTGVVAGLHST